MRHDAKRLATRSHAASNHQINEKRLLFARRPSRPCGPSRPIAAMRFLLADWWNASLFRSSADDLRARWQRVTGSRRRPCGRLCWKFELSKSGHRSGFQPDRRHAAVGRPCRVFRQAESLTYGNLAGRAANFCRVVGGIISPRTNRHDSLIVGANAMPFRARFVVLLLWFWYPHHQPLLRLAIGKMNERRR